MSNNKKPAKPLNPEEKLQASVGKDVKIRLMEEHLKFQSNIVSAAKWEETMPLKDEQAVKKRSEERSAIDSRLMKTLNKSVRKQRLEELYRQDEMKYEQELNDMGLAFRRERN